MQYNNELPLRTFIEGTANSQTVGGSGDYLFISDIQKLYTTHGPQGWVPLPRVVLSYYI